LTETQDGAKMSPSWVSYMEGKMENFDFGKCKLAEVTETENGLKYIFETDERFRDVYSKLFSLPEFEQEHFNKTFLEVLEFILKRAEEQRVKSSEFLWSTPKENNE